MDQEALTEWLRARFTDDEARNDWRIFLEAAVDETLSRPLEAVCSAELFGDLVSKGLNHPQLGHLVQRGTREALARWVARASENHAALSEGWPEGVQSRLASIVSRDALIDEAWVDVLVQQEATRALFTETLVLGLGDFSELVPSMFQGWAPSALGRFASRLQEAAGGVSERLREEARARFEPEIRKFADRATQRLLDGTAASVKAKLDTEPSKEARRNLLRYALSRSHASYAERIDASLQQDIDELVYELVNDGAVRAQIQRELKAEYVRLIGAAGGRPLKEVLELGDLDLSAELEDLCHLTWPIISAALRSPTMDRYFSRLSGDILSTLSGS